MARKKQSQASRNILLMMTTMRADSLTGFVAGFLVGIIGMYVYAVIVNGFV